MNNTSNAISNKGIELGFRAEDKQFSVVRFAFSFKLEKSDRRICFELIEGFLINDISLKDRDVTYQNAQKDLILRCFQGVLLENLVEWLDYEDFVRLSLVSSNFYNYLFHQNNNHENSIQSSKIVISNDADMNRLMDWLNWKVTFLSSIKIIKVPKDIIINDHLRKKILYKINENYDLLLNFEKLKIGEINYTKWFFANYNENFYDLYNSIDSYNPND